VRVNSLLRKFRLYVSLTKPGVLFGNAITAAAGFLVASQTGFNTFLFLAVFVGSTLIIASACVLNNYFDRDIDSVMARTRNRAIASGKIPGRNAVVLGVVLGLLGFGVLYFYTNVLVVLLGAIGFVDYLVLYAMLGKRKSMHGTLIGSISGAIPILSGYAGATQTIDLGGVMLFLSLFFWQMPEFYSIAIYRHDEYKKAGVPVISVVKGIQTTKRHILIYTLLFVVSTLSLFVSGYTGLTYLIVMVILDVWWLMLAIEGFYAKDSSVWARKMFRYSLIILLTFSFLLMAEMVLP
jgi:protoheme IX farnesyltransferase